jgi:Tol biopolymer transport system component
VDSSGIQGNNGSYDPVLSANGRFVAFSSIADNLVIGDNNGVQDVFVRDLKTGVTQRVSLDSSGAEGNNFSYNHAISANGRYIAFTSTASNLVDGDNNDTYDVFVRDLITGMTQRVSVNSVGIEGNSASSGPTLSANGRFVGFNSDANNLVLGDHNGYADIFVRRRW